jgi:hypothetical protein
MWGYMRYLLILIAFLGFCQLIACKGNETKGSDMRTNATPPDNREALRVVAGKKVFFAHQSVGRNILEGLAQISSGAATAPRVVQTSDPSAFAAPVFAHAPVGENGRPLSKLADFQRMLDDGIGPAAEVALVKLCYADINADTDVEKLAAAYNETMSRIKKSYPRLVLVHVTVPLRTVEKGVKTSIKRLTGLGTLQGYDDNIKRNEFNFFLRKSYDGKEPLFDLAALESTAPDGSMETFSVGGTTYQALFPGYTNDGGHLIGQGRQWAARGLMATLAQAVEVRRRQ